MGLLLPCTAVLRQAGAQVEVSILDPEVAFIVVESQTQKTLEDLPAGSREETAGCAERIGRVSCLKRNGCLFATVARNLYMFFLMR